MKLSNVIPLAKTHGKFEPRILLLDIETAPMNSWHWRMFKENISPPQTCLYSRLLCWAAKWLDSDAVYFDSAKKDIAEHHKEMRQRWAKPGARINPFEWHKYDDERLCREIWDLCDEATIIVAHNGKAFDMGFLQARWAKHDIMPPSPYKICDTLKIARRQFAVPSKALDALLRYFELGAKLSHTGWKLWIDCLANCRESWRVMEEYNIKDTTKLEELYLLVRPWAGSNHPNVSVMYDDTDTRCVCCGSVNLKEMPQASYTTVSVFPSYRCKNCGKVMRSCKRDKKDKTVLRHSL